MPAPIPNSWSIAIYLLLFLRKKVLISLPNGTRHDGCRSTMTKYSSQTFFAAILKFSLRDPYSMYSAQLETELVGANRMPVLSCMFIQTENSLVGITAAAAAQNQINLLQSTPELDMATDVLNRVLQGHADEDLYAMLGVQPMIGGADVAPPDRMRAFLVVKSLPTAVTKLNQDQSVYFVLIWDIQCGCVAWGEC